jgi:hypothetical protein
MTIGIIISWLLLIVSMTVGGYVFVEGSWWIFTRIFGIIDRYIQD